MLNDAVPVLRVRSVAAAEEFYCGLLGFRTEFGAPPTGAPRDPGYLGLARDGARLHLSSHAGDGDAGVVTYVYVDDVDALSAEFRRKGVPVHLDPTDQAWGMRELYVRDPDGNTIRFGSPVKGRGPDGTEIPRRRAGGRR